MKNLWDFNKINSAKQPENQLDIEQAKNVLTKNLIRNEPAINDLKEWSANQCIVCYSTGSVV